MGLGRNSWPLAAIRQLADAFLAAADGRKKSPAFEARWLNLCGFCLRPGFGYPGDDFRIEQARRIYVGRPDVRQPGAVRNRLVDLLGPRGRRAEPQPADRHLPAALAASCCRAAARSRSASTQRCCARCGARRPAWNCCPSAPRPNWATRWCGASKPAISSESELWCLSRLGARKLFYGPINLVVPPAAAARWAEALLRNLAGQPAKRWRPWRAAPKIPRATCRSHTAPPSGASWKAWPMPSAIWRRSKAKKNATANAGPDFRRRTALGAGAGGERRSPELKLPAGALMLQPPSEQR